MVITGSSRGLGRAFAIAAAAEGASVIVNGTNESALAETVEAVGSDNGRVIPVPGSVADPEVAERLVRTCVEQFGGIDVMVNNAGIVRDRTLLKMSVEDWDEVVRVHLRGAFLCTRQAALAMRESGGHIIQVISASGLVGGFGQGNYAAAKEGMIGLLRTSLLEFARYGIRSNALWPVGQTDMTQVVFERARAAAVQRGEAPPDPVDMGFGTPEEVAAGLVWLASDGAAPLQRPDPELQRPQDRALDPSGRGACRISRQALDRRRIGCVLQGHRAATRQSAGAGANAGGLESLSGLDVDR